MTFSSRPVLIVIAGPTASGKTQLAAYLALKLKTAVISADSRQIYREMKIGTAVPSNAILNRVKHYFIGHVGIHDYYNASMFEVEVLEMLKEIFTSSGYAIMAGGSGLYIDAVCRGIDDLPTIDPEIRKNLMEKLSSGGLENLRLEIKKVDPEYYRKADLKNPKRLLKALEVYYMTGKPYSSFCTQSSKQRDFEIVKFGLFPGMEILTRQIETRTDEMMAQGWLDEALALYPYRNLNALNTVGYKELFAYLDGAITLGQAVSLIKVNTRRYAKRQMSYFRRDKSITWLHPDEAFEKIYNIVS